MIIGVTGYIGAGKDVFAEYVCKKKGMSHISFKDAILDEARRQGICADRNSLQLLASRFESERGRYVWAERIAVSLRIMDRVYMRDGKNFSYLVETFRTPAQIEYFRNEFGKDFFLIGIYADFNVRWNRVQKRGKMGDPCDMASFLRADEMDMGIGQFIDKSIQQTEACRKLVDTELINNYNCLEMFFEDIEKFMKKF